MSNKNKNIITTIFSILIIAILIYYNMNNNTESVGIIGENKTNNTISLSSNYNLLADVPEYNSEISVSLNDNKPFFEESDYTTNAFEKYSELDSLGRCGVAYANICKETMPPEGDERGKINSVRPTGWIQTKINGEFLYNRCHLIAYSLSDEDANKQNLITGTRYFNVDGMLPYEMKVLEYLNKNSKNHVLYRVTPNFKGNELVARGVEIEAYSIEDNGEGVCFNTYIYNIQPGVTIDYSTGKAQENIDK